MISVPHTPITKNGQAIVDTETHVRIVVVRESPTITRIQHPKTNEVICRMRTVNLHKYFPEFEGPLSVEEWNNAEFEDGWLSILGETIEPDGWDSKGFPSQLLAMGLI